LHKTPFTKHLQNTAKHRNTQNTAKLPQNAFCEIMSQNTAKKTQNAQKSHKTVAIQPQYVLRAFGVFFKNTLDLSQKYTMRNTRKLRGVSRTSAGGHGLKKNSVLRCFCGVLWCFAVFGVRVFSDFYKTAQNRPKNIQNAQNEQNTRCAIQRNTVLCVFLSLRKCLYKKHSQNTSKTLQNIRKTPQNTAKHCFSKSTRKTPQNTRKTPAKHHKTPQNTTKQI